MAVAIGIAQSLGLLAPLNHSVLDPADVCLRGQTRMVVHHRSLTARIGGNLLAVVLVPLALQLAAGQSWALAVVVAVISAVAFRYFTGNYILASFGVAGTILVLDQTVSPDQALRQPDRGHVDRCRGRHRRVRSGSYLPFATGPGAPRGCGARPGEWSAGDRCGRPARDTERCRTDPDRGTRAEQLAAAASDRRGVTARAEAGRRSALPGRQPGRRRTGPPVPVGVDLPGPAPGPPGGRDWTWPPTPNGPGASSDERPKHWGRPAACASSGTGITADDGRRRAVAPRPSGCGRPPWIWRMPRRWLVADRR